MNPKESYSGLSRSNLMNNIIMDNHTRTNILDEPVPHIGVATLRPTPFRRVIQSLKDTTRKVVDAAKRKWNDYYDLIIGYVPQPIRDGSSIKKIEESYQRTIPTVS